MRAAMVGGGAYIAGKKVQEGHQREADQEERLEDVESQQAATPPAASAPPSVGTSDMIDQLKELGELLKEGVLTQAEFDEQKRKLLQSA